MLGIPHHGWVCFSLGEKQCELSYLNNIPVEWLDRAIFGLRTMDSFTVRGFCEPGTFQCTVERDRCHIVCCNEEESCAVNMLQFCKYLHEDISRNLDAWSRWQSVRSNITEKERQKLCDAAKKEISCYLGSLEKLIFNRESAF